jgi:hypothetical protein
MIPLQAALINIEDVRAAEFEIDTLTKNLANAQVEIQKKDATLQEKTIALNFTLNENQQIRKDLEAERKAVSDLTARVMELSKAAPVLLPIARKPIITRTDIRGIAGICVDKDDTPSAAQDENARELIVLASMMGFNTFRAFFNLGEVKTHLTLSETNIRHMPGYAKQLGMTFIADTVNSPVITSLSDPDFKVYIEGLIKMGAMAFYVDDANQYRETKNVDGTLKYPAGELERMVKRIRLLAPQTPIIASLRGSANPAEYKPLFDATEAQTFGGVITELEGFLKRPFDIFNLDAQRNEVSVAYLKASEEIVLRNNPRNIYYYPSTAVDLKNMPDRIGIIRQIVQRWMAMAR